ncbi:hypothetical protein AGMMS49587_19390 [Spirochaetia bacterium]|nr:hypothetical protein AGMMS49587_19390 [Spirochaetia bacterium]
MKTMGKSFLLFILLSAAVSSLSLRAADYNDGRIRLILNESTGRFSLYYMTDITRARYESLFASQDPMTSLLTVNVNNAQYRLGESDTFSIRIGGNRNTPSLIFESSSLVVTEEFSFIKTAKAPVANGVKITLTIENKSTRSADVGLRLLLNTELGEGGTEAPFMTDVRPILSEIVFNGSSGDQLWLTRNDHLSLIGSISAGVEKKPDIIHFANWKRLNDAPWKAAYAEGRNFHDLPSNSIGDAGVAYFFDPRRMASGDSLSFSLLLAADSSQDDSFANGLAAYTASTHETPVAVQRSAPTAQRADNSAAVQTDLGSLRNIIAKIDAYINSGSPIRDEDLAALEREFSQIRSRYGK